MNISSLYNRIIANANLSASESLRTFHNESINLESGNSDINSKAEESSFKDIMNQQIEKVNQKQLEADRITQDFISGEEDDLHSVMIAAEEARLSLELAVQVRNKCVEAYKELSNIQL